MYMQKTVTWWLLVINTVVFFLQMLFGKQFTTLFALTPSLAFRGYFWQFVTYMFLHADFSHIFLNMFTLLMFAPRIEHEMGSKRFLIYYLICGIGSGLFHIAFTGISNVPMVGASGAIYGVLTAFGVMFPNAIVLVMGIIPMKALKSVIVFGVIQFLLGIMVPGSAIAYFGHVGGIVVGLILLYKFDFRKRREWQWFWEFY